MTATDLRRENRALRDRIERAERDIYSICAVAANPYEQDAIREVVARVDSVAGLYGERSPEPRAGEDATDFQRRALNAILPHSPKHAGLDARDIPLPMLPQVEAEALADARRAAEIRDSQLRGEMRAHVTTDEAGRRITRYFGDIGTWFHQFSTDGARCAVNRSMIGGK